MPHRKDRADRGDIVHVILRGVRQMDLFRDDEDRSLFLRRLDLACARFDVRLLAWSLMTNHVHLQPVRGEAPLAGFVHSFASTYARSFNARHGAAGAVFEGRHRRVPIRSEEQLLTCVRYVHLNPVVAGVAPDVEALARYRWTGHAALVGGRVPRFQDASRVLRLFAEDVSVAQRRLIAFMERGVEVERERWG